MSDEARQQKACPVMYLKPRLHYETNGIWVVLPTHAQSYCNCSRVGHSFWAFRDIADLLDTDVPGAVESMRRREHGRAGG